MKAYLEMLQHITKHGRSRPDRTGVGTIGVFGWQFRHALKDGFPCLTTKQVWFRGAAEELFWMLSGSTSAKPLQEKGVHIWDAWADADGNLGPIYGKQWRDFGGVDQITAVVKSLKEDPFGRRHVVSAWNPGELPFMALPPCPTLFQFYAHGNWGLSLHLYQRSADAFLGVPFDIAGYALLTHLMGHVLNRVPVEIIISYGDLHIYRNHTAQVETVLARVPNALPTLWIDPGAPQDLLELRQEHIQLRDYKHQGAVPAPVAV